MTPARTAPATATILVVEDNGQVRNLVVTALERGGFRVHEAPGGPQALAKLSTFDPIDLLITDVMMADMDGIELAGELLSRCNGLRVLFMSGYPLETLRDRHAVLPASIQLLEKPFTGGTLVDKVHEVLEEPAPLSLATVDDGRVTDGD